MAATKEAVLVRVENLQIVAGDFETKELNLTIQRECHALLGPSGSGKSTLLKALLGLHPIKNGTIYFDNRAINQLPIHMRGFGYVPQYLALFPHMTVRQNILYGIKAQKKRLDKPFLNELLRLSDISHLLKRYPNTLSGGEKQRVALLRAIVTKPKMLLLDEPFSALDNTLKKELWLFLKRIQNEFDLPILLVTHDLEEVRFLADRVTLLINGVIHQSGTPQEVIDHPKTVAAARYTGMHNILCKESWLYQKLGCQASCIAIDKRKIRVQKSPTAIAGTFQWIELNNYALAIVTTAHGEQLEVIAPSKQEGSYLSIPKEAITPLRV